MGSSQVTLASFMKEKKQVLHFVLVLDKVKALVLHVCLSSTHVSCVRVHEKVSVTYTPQGWGGASFSQKVRESPSCAGR